MSDNKQTLVSLLMIGQMIQDYFRNENQSGSEKTKKRKRERKKKKKKKK